MGEEQHAAKRNTQTADLLISLASHKCGHMLYPRKCAGSDMEGCHTSVPVKPGVISLILPGIAGVQITPI